MVTSLTPLLKHLVTMGLMALFRHSRPLSTVIRCPFLLGSADNARLQDDSVSYPVLPVVISCPHILASCISARTCRVHALQ